MSMEEDYSTPAEVVQIVGRTGDVSTQKIP